MVRNWALCSALLIAGCSNEVPTESAANVADSTSSTTDNTTPVAATADQAAVKEAVSNAKSAQQKIEDVRSWSCDGATGRFTMRLSNIENANWGIWGTINYSGGDPFDYVEDSKSFAYSRDDDTFTIGGNPETGEEGIDFFAQNGELTANVGAGANQVLCKPA